MVRELGLKRRETVWSLSTVHFKKKISFTPVREDRGQQANCDELSMYLGMFNSYA